jgi:hypothetical protein
VGFSRRFGAHRARALWAALSLALVAVPSNGTATASDPNEDWPAIQAGIWETACTRTLPSGKTQHWNVVVSACHDPSELLRGYWGLGAVEEAGCRYEAVKVSTDKFKITSECMVRHAGIARSTATAIVKNGGTFEMRIEVVEGKKIYRGSQIGHFQSACPPVGRSK